MPDYGKHSAEEIIEAYEAALAVLGQRYPFQVGLIKQYVEEVLLIDGTESRKEAP